MDKRLATARVANVLSLPGTVLADLIDQFLIQTLVEKTTAVVLRQLELGMRALNAGQIADFGDVYQSPERETPLSVDLKAAMLYPASSR